jgi:hypothetical protein
MLAGIIFRVDRALGKERLRNEREAARYETKEHLRSVTSIIASWT